jgi:hypothetical protein
LLPGASALAHKEGGLTTARTATNTTGCLLPNGVVVAADESNVLEGHKIARLLSLDVACCSLVAACYRLLIGFRLLAARCWLQHTVAR